MSSPVSPLVSPKAMRYKKACRVAGYKFPPRHIQSNLFKDRFFLTDSQLHTLSKDRHVFGFSHHGKAYLTVNPCSTWVWSQDDIDYFWQKIS